MHYVGYDKRSLGNILHFLHSICGLHVAEYVMINFQNSSINLHGKLFAFFKFDEEGFPEFEFADHNRYKSEWVEEQRNEAIKGWNKYGPNSKKRN